MIVKHPYDKLQIKNVSSERGNHVTGL